MKRGLLYGAFLLALLVGLTTSSAFAASIELLQPSERESTFAPRRDFMVVGRLVGVDRSAKVRIELYDADKRLVRSLTSEIDLSAGAAPEGRIFTDYKQGKYYKEDGYAALKNNPPPDLLTDAAGNMNNPAAKIIINRDRQFAAVIFGGVSKAFDLDYRDEDLGDYADLAAGKYELKITALDSATGTELAVCRRRITFAPSNMLFGRFSPDQRDGYPHKEALTAFAKKHKLRVLLDAVPGYWSQDKSAAGGEVFYEIPARWRINDLGEYLASRNICGVIYNITSFSTTQTLEIGGLLQAKYFEDMRPGRHVYLYRYDIGEPELLCRAEDGTQRMLTGEIVPFDGEMKSRGYRRLVLARAELRDGGIATADNEYWPYQTEKTVALRPEDGLRISRGQTVSLFGAAAPLPTSDIETITQGDAKERVLRYEVKNRLRDIAYTVTDPTGASLRLIKPVALKRHYFVNRSATSLYEFKHDFGADILRLPGVYTIAAQGLDAHGQPVERAAAQLSVTVK